MLSVRSGLKDYLSAHLKIVHGESLSRGKNHPNVFFKLNLNYLFSIANMKAVKEPLRNSQETSRIQNLTIFRNAQY